VGKLEEVLSRYDAGAVTKLEAATAIAALLCPDSADVILCQIGDRVEILRELLWVTRDWVTDKVDLSLN